MISMSANPIKPSSNNSKPTREQFRSRLMRLTDLEKRLTRSMSERRTK